MKVLTSFIKLAKTDQPGQMPRMLRVIAECISISVGFVRQNFIKLLHAVYQVRIQNNQYFQPIVQSVVYIEDLTSAHVLLNY